MAATTASKLLSLVFVFDGSRVLLGLKRRGFGVGKFNGFGGKMEVGERMRECAARELHEESGLEVDARLLRRRGLLTFNMLAAGWDTSMVVDGAVTSVRPSPSLTHTRLKFEFSFVDSWLSSVLPYFARWPPRYLRMLATQAAVPIGVEARPPDNRHLRDRWVFVGARGARLLVRARSVPRRAHDHRRDGGQLVAERCDALRPDVGRRPALAAARAAGLFYNAYCTTIYFTTTLLTILRNWTSGGLTTATGFHTCCRFVCMHVMCAVHGSMYKRTTRSIHTGNTCR